MGYEGVYYIIRPKIPHSKLNSLYIYIEKYSNEF